MVWLIVFLVTFFLLALYLGRRFYESKFWHYVDLIYYPLAAVGVALLFANTTVQRQLLELTQLEETHKELLADLVEKRPQVRVDLNQEAVDASFGLVATIPEFAKACRYPGNIDPRCTVAEKLAPLVENFVKIASTSPGKTLELRLAVACPAADKMILALREDERMSAIIGDELVVRYKEAVGKKLQTLSLNFLKEEIDTFQRSADSELKLVRNALNDESPSAKYVMDMYKHEIEFGAILMQGLFPCITSSRQEIDTLANWTKSHQTEKDQLASFDAERKKMSTAGPQFPQLARLHLFIWPYVLVLALSLKFAKGVAAVKKLGPVRRSLPNPLQEGQQAAAVSPTEMPPALQPETLDHQGSDLEK
jgi:hypothetical protein